MHKYQIIFTLNNGSSIALPEDNFNLAVKVAKALIKLKVVSDVFHCKPRNRRLDNLHRRRKITASEALSLSALSQPERV